MSLDLLLSTESASKRFRYGVVAAIARLSFDAVTLFYGNSPCTNDSSENLMKANKKKN